MIFNSAIWKKNQIYWPGVWALIYTVVQEVSKLYCKNPITDRPRTTELIISVTKTFPFTENPKSLTATMVQDGVRLSKLSTIHGSMSKLWLADGNLLNSSAPQKNVTNGVK